MLLYGSVLCENMERLDAHGKTAPREKYRGR